MLHIRGQLHIAVSNAEIYKETTVSRSKLIAGGTVGEGSLPNYYVRLCIQDVRDLIIKLMKLRNQHEGRFLS